MLRKSLIAVFIVAIGGALVYFNLTFERSSGPEERSNVRLK